MGSNNGRSAVWRAAIEALEDRRLLSLAAPVSYPAEYPTWAVATGDLNGDGRADVVASKPDNGGVGVRLSSADGTLQAAQTFAAGVSPVSVAVGDVNNDGKLDVVTANRANANLSVLLGAGNGTFQPPIAVVLPPQFPPGYTGTTPLAQLPTSVAVGDLNNDGKMDLAVTSDANWSVPYLGPYGGTYERWYGHSYANVLIGNGNGAFTTASTYGRVPAVLAAVRDFNNDGKLDVLLGPDADVMLGNGNGTLQPPVQSNSVYTSRGTAVGDFDNDGKLDLVKGVELGGLYVQRGRGDGTFADPVGVSSDAVRSVVTGDVNGDGKLDIVASTQRTTFEFYDPYYGGQNPTTTDSTQVLLGYGDGTFTLPVTTTMGGHPGLGMTNASALGDLNGDGRPDLVATDPLNSAMFVQVNRGGWVVPAALTVGDVTVTEGNSGTSNAVFTVTLRHLTNGQAVSVKYATADETATGGGDFVPTTGTLTFAPGETTKTISVPVTGDRAAEGDETFTVLLTGATNADVIDGVGVGTIAEDEPRISINDVDVDEGDSGTTPAVFTVSLSNPYDQEVAVSYYTLTGHTTDIVASNGTIRFAPGETQKTITIAVVGDRLDEDLEAFNVVLQNPTPNALLDDAWGYGKILDDDELPQVRVTDVTRAEGNSGTTAFQFTVFLSAPSEGDVSVKYATANGTAGSTGGQKDYSSTSGTITFAAGQSSRTVVVGVSGDTRTEPDETFFLNLTNVVNATLVDAQGVGTILNDETRGKKWVGPASGGNWSTAANWSPSGVPTADSLVAVDASAVTLAADATVAEVSLTGGATLAVAANGGRVLRTPHLFLDGGSKLNLNDNALILDYAGGTPMADVTAWLAAGRAATPGGIYSPQANASAGARALGFAEAAAALGLAGSQAGSFAGQGVDATAVLVRYTLAADTNLDRAVNFPDLLVLAKNYNKSGATFATGDANHDGLVNFADLLVLARSYNQTLAVAAPPPEPEAFAAALSSAAPAVRGDEAAGSLFSTQPIQSAPPKAKLTARRKP